MTGEDVLAVVVSYNGLDRTLRTVEAVSPQVGHVLVVDNGSAAASQAWLHELDSRPGVTVDRLGANRGIGHALNRAVRYAEANGYRWLLTMDQDSVAHRAMIAAYAEAITKDPTLVCLAPSIRKNGVASAAHDGPIDYAITSGNLVHVDLFAEIGQYDEAFFIDCVDFDFSLRVRRAGHQVHRVARALLEHELGEAVRAPAMARRFYARHSPARRYYMYRNFLYMARRYARPFPAFIAKLTLSQALLTILVAFLDPEPLASYRAIGRGVRDYLGGRQGPDPSTAQ
jgi:rhamnosyltransferase